MQSSTWARGSRCKAGGGRGRGLRAQQGPLLRRVCLCSLFGVREGKAAAQGHQAAQEEEAEEETQKWSEQTKNVEKQCEKYTVQQQKALILAGKETASFPLSTLCSLVFSLSRFL